MALPRELADSIGDPAVGHISILKATRIGYSSLLSATVAHHIANNRDPGRLPVKSDCRGFMVDTIEPLFEASPALRGTLKPPSRRPKERSTIRHGIFPGGSLRTVTSKAPRNLRAHNGTCWKVVRCLPSDDEAVADTHDCREAEIRMATAWSRRACLLELLSSPAMSWHCPQVHWTKVHQTNAQSIMALGRPKWGIRTDRRRLCTARSPWFCWR